MDSSHFEKHTNFPVLLVSCVLIFTCILLGWVAYYTIATKRSFEHIREESLLAKELRGQIVYLDEVLTMSARMAALTGDLSWKERYDTFVVPLNGAIEGANDGAKLGACVGAKDGADEGE